MKSLIACEAGTMELQKKKKTVTLSNEENKTRINCIIGTRDSRLSLLHPKCKNRNA